MSERDRLRKLLEDHGLSCQTHYLHVSWHVGPKLYEAYCNLNGTLTVDNLTPEQAIAATLGDEYKRGYEDGLHANTKAAFAAAKQAIAIALDDNTKLNELLDEFERECFMLRVEASETRARDNVVRNSYERIRDRYAERMRKLVVER